MLVYTRSPLVSEMLGDAQLLVSLLFLSQVKVVFACACMCIVIFFSAYAHEIPVNAGTTVCDQFTPV